MRWLFKGWKMFCEDIWQFLTQFPTRCCPFHFNATSPSLKRLWTRSADVIYWYQIQTSLLQTYPWGLGVRKGEDNSNLWMLRCVIWERSESKSPAENDGLRLKTRNCCSTRLWCHDVGWNSNRFRISLHCQSIWVHFNVQSLDLLKSLRFK